MPSNKYNVYPEVIKSIDYQILVLGLPHEDIEDLLTKFVVERGKISRSLYEDFIIANCVGNLNQFMAYIQSIVGSTETSLVDIRKEVIESIIIHNEVLKPENIVINRNHVLKLKTDNDQGSTPLIENTYWNKSYYNDDGKYSAIPPDKDPMLDKSKEFIKTKKDTKSTDTPDTKVGGEIEWEEAKVWWDRINEYITIKKYSPENIDRIIKQRYFHNRTSFNTNMVSNCVVNVEEIYERIEGMGVNVDPNKIIRELFSLCEGVNEGMNFKRAKELQPDDDTEEEDTKNNKGSGPNRKAQASNGYTKKKTKIKSTFKDVVKADLLKLSDNMKVSLVGQNEAVDSLAESIKRASVGLKDPIKPIGSFLFAGRTGCGKTLASKVLADELIKAKKNRIVIDCSEYTADHEYAKLIGCFVPGSKVLMGDGSLKNIEEISIGDEVISHTGNKRLVEFVHQYDQDGEMVELLMSNTNVPVVTTNTHEILAIKHSRCDKGKEREYRICKPTCKQEYCVDPPYDRYKMDWIPASELKKNDIVVYPRYKSTGEFPNKLDLVDYIEDSGKYKYDDSYVWAQRQVKVPRYVEINEDFTRLAGYYVSEGGSAGSSKSINFTFNSKEHSYITEVVKLIRRIFGDDLRIRIEDRTENNSHRIWVSSKIVCRLMCALFGKGTYVKQVPSWFKDMPDNLVKGFLETAIFGDGCTVVPRRIDYSTVSSTLFSQMELLFRRLGYITYKSVEVPKNPKCAQRYRLYIGGNQIEKINKEFNFNIDMKDIKETSIQRKAWIDDDYVYFQLKDVRTTNYTGKVYDLAVEKDTSYIIEFSVHNSPAGYIGHDSGGVLTNAINEDPFSVVVFDEVEKASSKVHELMLQILDEGRLTDGKGVTVSFKDSIIIMTSNIGIKEVDAVAKTVGFGDVAVVTEDKKSQALDKALKAKFKPEFLNRIDSVIYFKDLKKKDYMRIIDIELYKLSENLKNNDTEYRDIELYFDDKVRDFIYSHGVDDKFGARPIKRAIEKHISTNIAEVLLNGDFGLDSCVNVSVKSGKVFINVTEPIENIMREG